MRQGRATGVISRSMALILLATMAVGVSGCGTGNASSAASHTAITRARARAVASAVNLRAEDLPPGITAAPQQPSARDRRESDAEEKRCFGYTIPGWVQALSDEFTGGSAFGTQRTWSDVIIRSSASVAQADLRRSRSHQARECLMRRMRRSWTHARFRDLGGAHGTVRGTLFAPLAVTAPGSDGSVAWQTIIGLKVRGVGVIVYEDVVTFTYGQDNIALISFGINRPFPIEKEQSLAAFLVARARAHTR